MPSVTSLPLFHLYGDPPDDRAFDFIHIETIASRSQVHDWTISPHRHRNLFQILLLTGGGGEMVLEEAVIEFSAPTVMLVPPPVAHGFRFAPRVSEGWVLSFSDDVAAALGEQGGAFAAWLREAARQPVIPLPSGAQTQRLARLCAELNEEHLMARDGHRLAMRSLLALIGIGVARLAASQALSGVATLQPADATVAALRALVETHFRSERQVAFYADALAMTPDRLNDHVKRAAGVTAGHLIRQRVATEAKRQLVFTGATIHEIAFDLGFADPSHFARFFRTHTGTSPQAFRARRGG